MVHVTVRTVCTVICLVSLIAHASEQALKTSLNKLATKQYYLNAVGSECTASPSYFVTKRYTDYKERQPIAVYDRIHEYTPIYTIESPHDTASTTGNPLTIVRDSHLVTIKKSPHGLCVYNLAQRDTAPKQILHEFIPSSSSENDFFDGVKGVDRLSNTDNSVVIHLGKKIGIMNLETEKITHQWNIESGGIIKVQPHSTGTCIGYCVFKHNTIQDCRSSLCSYDMRVGKTTMLTELNGQVTHVSINPSSTYYAALVENRFFIYDARTQKHDRPIQVTSDKRSRNSFFSDDDTLVYHAGSVLGEKQVLHAISLSTGYTASLSLVHDNLWGIRFIPEASLMVGNGYLSGNTVYDYNK